jgi:hypothetical protein
MAGASGIRASVGTVESLADFGQLAYRASRRRT